MELSKNATIEWYDEIEGSCYEAVEEALKTCRYKADNRQVNDLDSSDIWDIAKRMTETMLDTLEGWGIDYPDQLECF